MDAPDTTLGAAHAFPEVGFAVFPVVGKKPHKGTRGFHDATRDFEAIDAMWKRWPGSGVAIATGVVSKVWVLDIDGPDGLGSLRRLTLEHGPLPPTVTTRTRDGNHLFWCNRVEEVGSNAGQVAPGIDVRGNGGYVVCPPSPHPDGGRYAWVRDPFNHDIAEAPEWLLELVVRRPVAVADFPAPAPVEGVHRDRYVEAAIEAECRELAQTPEGGRNDQLNRSAFALARFVVGGDVPASVVVWRLARAARAAGLPPREVEKTLTSAFRARRVA